MHIRSLARRATPLLAQTRRASSFRPGPAPPKLPSEEQAEFERLQRKAAVSSAFQPDAETDERPAARQADAAAAENKAGDDMNPGFRRGARPEFEGEVNPKTGEVGGPKNDPLRWKGDWSYNGRVTDF